VLDAALRCPGCGVEHASVRVDDGPRVAVLLEPDDAAAGLAATARILERLDAGPDALAGVPTEDDAPYLSALAIFGGAHFGRWATPPLPSPSLRWIDTALAHARPLPAGPASILGAATGGEALALPPEREVVVLDGSVPLLGLLSGLAAVDQPLPVQTTPGRYSTRRVALPGPVRERLRRLRLVAADAREPPLRPGAFALVLALNLLDSITHPRELLLQARALLAPGGALVLSSPFNWDDHVTPPARRLDADLPPHADRDAALEARLAALWPDLVLRWSDRDVPWPLRVHDRLCCEFRLHAMLWQHAR
jgi:SAM-dependent methyltransferase